MSLLLFLQMFLEFDDPPLQVRVYLYVPGHNALHAAHILINIVLNRAHALDI